MSLSSSSSETKILIAPWLWNWVKIVQNEKKLKKHHLTNKIDASNILDLINRLENIHFGYDDDSSDEEEMDGHSLTQRAFELALSKAQ